MWIVNICIKHVDYQLFKIVPIKSEKKHLDNVMNQTKFNTKNIKFII